MSVVEFRAFQHRSKFTEETLHTIAGDLKSRRLPLQRVEVSDDMAAGLRAVLLSDGSITYHAPSGALGRGDAGASGYITIPQARILARVSRSVLVGPIVGPALSKPTD